MMGMMLHLLLFLSRWHQFGKPLIPGSHTHPIRWQSGNGSSLNHIEMGQDVRTGLLQNKS